MQQNIYFVAVLLRKASIYDSLYINDFLNRTAIFIMLYVYELVCSVAMSVKLFLIFNTVFRQSATGFIPNLILPYFKSEYLHFVIFFNNFSAIENPLNVNTRNIQT